MRRITRLCVLLLAVSAAVVGVNIRRTGDFLLPLESKWLALLCTLLVIGVLTLMLDLFGRLIVFDAEKAANLAGESRVNCKVFFLVIVLTDLLLLLAYYPGTASRDTCVQIRDFFDGTAATVYNEGGGMLITAFLNDHHPVFTTLLFSAFASFGRLIHHERFGVFLYSFFQIILYASVCTETVRVYQNRRGPLSGWFVALFYVLNLFLAYYAVTMLKDSLYSILLLPYTLCFVRLWRREDAFSKRQIVLFLLLSVLLPLTKKTGIYLVLICNLVLLFHSRREKRVILPIAAATLLPAFLMFFFLPHVIFPAFQIYPGGRQEAIGFMLQQSAGVGIVDPDAYTEEEKELLNRVFDYDGREEHYNFHNIDQMKRTFKLETVTDADLKEYYLLWLKTGLRHPGTYLKSIAGTCTGFFSPTEFLEVYRVNHLYELTEVSALVTIREAVETIYDFFVDLPVLNVLMLMVLYSWWIPLFGTYQLIRRKGWRSLGMLMPVYVSVLILIVCPLSVSRYALPLVMLTPIILCEATDPMQI